MTIDFVLSVLMNLVIFFVKIKGEDAYFAT